MYILKKKTNGIEFISNSKGLPIGQGGSIVKLQTLKKYKTNSLARHKVYNIYLENKVNLTIIIKPKKKFNFPRFRMSLDTRKDLNFIEKISKKYNLLNLKIEEILKLKK